MGSFRSKSGIWEAIDLSESYLLCSMFEDAISLSSSILRLLHGEIIEEDIQGTELVDMTESAAMVFVQSLKELGRTEDIFSELEGLCGSIAAIPCSVVLTGACLQLAEGLSPKLKSVLECFLGVWKAVDEESLVCTTSDVQIPSEKCSSGLSLRMEEYLQVVDIYIFQVLASVPQDIDHAIAWTEKNAECPKDKRQDLLRRLHSLHSVRSSRSFVDLEKHGLAEIPSNLSRDDGDKEHVRTLQHLSENYLKSKMLRALEPCFWWQRIVHLKCGNKQLAFQCGSVATLGIFIIAIYYVLRKKWTTLQRIASGQLNSAKRVLLDAWHLAFSVQVNPLAAVAAVQPLTAAVPPGSR